MGKLFSLKEWVTVADAAKYLSVSLGEEVNEADVLRLALDGHITLSIYLPNGATVKRGKIVTHRLDDVVDALKNNRIPEGLDWMHVPKSMVQKNLASLTAIDDDSEEVPFITSLRLNDTQWITLERETISTVWGLWDLPMFGGERLDVEHECLSITGGPSITAETMEGAFIWHSEDSICQIQADFDDNEYQRGSKAEGLELERRIVEDGIPADEADKQRAAFETRRKEYKKRRKEKPYHENFYPSEALPNDSMIVVRTSALRDFEKSLGGPPSGEEKPLSARERETLLTLIAAMAKEGYKHDPANKAKSAVSEILADAQRAGLSISDQTIRDKLKDAWKLLPGNPHKI
ncbi:hypothetical protein [Bordetella petrii]|uniref:hypothetical protein n=1 Tax=Bordetella petrii TaxID=94624 RepID=UPI001A962D2B|nr:hypothetical protein [Bordetella petrii]MBO1114663.1 hypothetical protein [Bordetella petrii]